MPRLAGATPVPRNVRRAPAVADDADMDSPALSAAWWWASKSSDSSASAAREPSLPQDDVARLLCCAISPGSRTRRRAYRGGEDGQEVASPSRYNCWSIFSFLFLFLNGLLVHLDVLTVYFSREHV